MTPLKCLLPPACALLLLCPSLPAAAAEDQAPAAAAQSDQPPTLSAAQQRAVGIVVAAAWAAKLPQRTDAYGEVLDPAQLVADAGRADAARAAATAAAAETVRLQGLYRGANASLKAVQVAEAAQIEARARADEAQTEFVLHWGPLAQLADAPRASLLAQLAAGRQLLLRADLPGRHSLGTLPRQALVDVDGIEVPARVLGPLPQAAAQVQSTGLLLQMATPPAGLGANARLPVTLEGKGRDGCVVPNGALLYGEQGAYVYQQLADKTKDGDTRFAALPVTLLQPQGDGWLVAGLRPDARIVVRGAGALWSLQGLGNISGEDTD